MVTGVQQESLSAEKEQFWRDKIAEQGSSGLSIRTFCDSNELREKAFYWWRGKLFGKTAKASKRSGPRQKRKKREYSKVQQRRFVQRWRASGLSQAAFCEREGLRQWEFSNWKCRITRQESEKKKRAPFFAEVKINPRDSGTTGTAEGLVPRKVIAEISFAGGSISITSDADALAVRNIIIAVKEAARDWTK